LRLLGGAAAPADFRGGFTATHAGAAE
jgi:hypothetical protein